jgi:hypothetical protein
MAGPVVELVAAARPGRALGLVLVAPIPTAGARLPAEVIDSFKSVSGFLGIRRQAAPSTREAEFGRIAAAAANTRPEFISTTRAWPAPAAGPRTRSRRRPMAPPPSSARWA